MVLGPEPGRASNSIDTLVLTCGTDNRSNSFLLDRMITTKFPLAVVLMEVAAQSHLRNTTLRARWIPRLQNEEADALTNSEYHHFDPAKRIDVDLGALPFVILNELFEAGDAFVAELQALKDSEKARKVELKSAKKCKALRGETLAQRDPW